MDLQTPKEDQIKGDVLILYALEISEIEVEIQDEDGEPVDLSGLTLVFTAKENWEDADGDAIIDSENSSHADAANGISSVAVDLSNVSETIQNSGTELVGDFWTVDGEGNREPYGAFNIVVRPSVTKGFGS